MLPDQFKKSYSVSYEEAQKDSMLFRLGVGRVMEEMEGILLAFLQAICLIN
jgi:hypothetical protein